MIIPKLEGHFDQSGFFIYIACDVSYFISFGPTIINSIRQNTDIGIHVHLYNPVPVQIDYCNNIDNVSVTYEYVPVSQFEHAASYWHENLTDLVDQLNYKRIITAMSKGNDLNIAERIQKTYYASARFIRLAELINRATSCFAIDVDAIVRKNIPLLPNTHDFYIHQITGPKARFLAGGLFLTGVTQGYNFIQEYATALKENLLLDKIHWGMDQDLLDHIVPKYNFGCLPLSYIDWNMKLDSYIWTAKGTRKENHAFIAEQMKYSS